MTLPISNCRLPIFNSGRENEDFCPRLLSSPVIRIWNSTIANRQLEIGNIYCMAFILTFPREA
jgi:hypothetical protein